MDADVWVMQKGVSNMHMASSMVWDWKVDRVEQIPGVKAVSAVLYLNGPLKIGGQDWFSYIIGVSPKYINAGPWSVAQGKSLPDAGEAVIPEVISRLTGIQLGDEVTLVDRPLRVVGLSIDTFSMASSVVFVSREDLGSLLEAGDQYSYQGRAGAAYRTKMRLNAENRMAYSKKSLTCQSVRDFLMNAICDLEGSGQRHPGPVSEEKQFHHAQPHPYSRRRHRHQV
ncbi:ABC transporter permease [Pontibacterium granulatum]|uniref:ABC transporter permease n=1 Tax=Pontibacterium granulatum TaxID=2036029 RepID=UPI003CE52AF3